MADPADDAVVIVERDVSNVESAQPLFGGNVVFDRRVHVDPAHGSYSCVVEALDALAVFLRHTPALAPVQKNASKQL